MELMKLQPVAEGLPNCILKQVKAVEVLNEPEGLKNISKRLSRGQLMAMLVGVSSSCFFISSHQIHCVLNKKYVFFL